MAEGDRFTHEFFVEGIALGIDLRAGHTIYTNKMVIGKGSSELIAVEHKAEKQAAGFAHVETLHQEDVPGHSMRRERC